MVQTCGRRGRVPHLWIILSTILALAAFRFIEDIPSRSQAEAVSTLEPAFSPPGGYYSQDVHLEITTRAPSVNVIFTVDGSVPTHTTGTVYAQPIRLSAATPAVTVVRARAVLPGAELGLVVSASFFVGVPATLPMISLIINPDDLWNPDRGIYANHSERGDAWERLVDVTYVDRDRGSGFHIRAGIRIHGGGSRSFGKKALRLYFRQEYGISRLEYPLFAGSEVGSFKRLVLHNSGQDWAIPYRGDWGNWTLIRNQLADRLALELGGHATHNQPALVFINGEPWGIYQIRERLDDHFLADHYGIESAGSVRPVESSPDQVVLMGDSQHWEHLLRFAAGRDLADPAYYTYIQSQIEMAEFIDYIILQIYAANADWPHHNVQRFRPYVQGGRWHWVFWDSDGGFGAYPVVPYSRVDSDWVQHVLDFRDTRTGRRDLLLLRELLQNPVFLQRFLSRAADLLNTTLSSQLVTAHTDALSAELEPDIAYETIRWPNSTSWESNMQELRDFALHRPDFVRQHIVEGFNLSGTARLSFNPPVDESGYVAVNGTLVPDLPWHGEYFQGVSVQVTAVPVPGFRFAGWDPPELPQSPTITLTVSSPQTLTPRFEAIGTDAPRPGDVICSRYRIDSHGSVAGERFELLVTRPGGVDLRGWRVTDNDTKTATDEGSLVFTGNPAFARVPRGTTILVITTRATDTDSSQDDLGTWDRRMVLFAGNGNLDSDVDPGFHLGPNDNLAILAPGPTQAFGDDQGIALVAEGKAVTPGSFGVLADGVLSTSCICQAAT